MQYAIVPVFQVEVARRNLPRVLVHREGQHVQAQGRPFFFGGQTNGNAGARRLPVAKGLGLELVDLARPIPRNFLKPIGGQREKGRKREREEKKPVQNTKKKKKKPQQ